MLRWTIHQKGGPKRHLPAAVAVGNKVYAFGGLCNSETYKYYMDQIDVNIFNALSLRWIKLFPVTTIGQQADPLAEEDEVPSMRYGHTTVLIDSIIYIWGGVKFTLREYCNVPYTFNVDTHRWSLPRISGKRPGARSGHSACVLEKVMYIFGGFNKLTKYSNDIYKLDTATMVWALINTSGTPAPARWWHSATLIGTKMLVYGGIGDRDQIGDYSNVRVFDTETDGWLSTPFSQLLPEERWSHSAFVYKEELYIFGGHNFRLQRNINDLWKYNPKTFSWKKVETKGDTPSWVYRMCCCRAGGLILLFGGYLSDDLYILDLSPRLKTLCKLAVIQYQLEKSELPHDVRWELSVMPNVTNMIEPVGLPQLGSLTISVSQEN